MVPTLSPGPLHRTWPVPLGTKERAPGFDIFFPGFSSYRAALLSHRSSTWDVKVGGPLQMLLLALIFPQPPPTRGAGSGAIWYSLGEWHSGAGADGNPDST